MNPEHIHMRLLLALTELTQTLHGSHARKAAPRIAPTRGRAIQRQNVSTKTSAVGARYARRCKRRRLYTGQRTKIGIRQDITTASVDQNVRMGARLNGDGHERRLRGETVYGSCGGF